MKKDAVQFIWSVTALTLSPTLQPAWYAHNYSVIPTYSTQKYFNFYASNKLDPGSCRAWFKLLSGTVIRDYTVFLNLGLKLNGNTIRKLYAKCLNWGAI